MRYSSAARRGILLRDWRTHHIESTYVAQLSLAPQILLQFEEAVKQRQGQESFPTIVSVANELHAIRYVTPPLASGQSDFF